MSTCVPGKQIVSGELKFISNVLQAAGMFVAAVKYQNGFFGIAVRGGPGAIEQLDAIVRRKKPFFSLAHQCLFPF